MTNHLETTTDAAPPPADANIASKALLTEVHNDLSSSTIRDITAVGQNASNYIKSMFGDLTIVDDHSKDKSPLLTNCSLFERAPSEEDKQALRDLGQKARDRVSELMEPEKKAEVDKLGDGIKDEKAKEQFKRDIETVEHRNPPISAAERGNLYNQVAKLMEASDNPNVPLTAEDRSKLAQEIMHKAADPTSVDQGTRGTCNVATVESRTFTRDPAAAAKLIVDVATTGEYTAADGTKIKPDPGSIKGDFESQNPGYYNNPRDHADQIFQVTAVNAVWQTHDLTVNDGQGGSRTFPKGTVEYRETDPKTGEPIGEGLYDKSKTPPERIMENGKAVDHPHINGDQITDVSNLITGKNEKGIVLEHSGPNAAEKTVKIESEADLKAKLAEMKKNGELPAIIEVNTGNPPFWGENIKLSPGFIPSKTGEHGEHVVTITDYDEKTGLVSLDNQWGQGRDHIGGSGISTGDLYIATMPPGSKETIQILQKDVQWNRDHNTINTSKELELLRQENAGGQLSNEELQTQVDKTMNDARKRWDANGTKPDDIERKQAEENYAKITKSLERHTVVQMQTH